MQKSSLTHTEIFFIEFFPQILPGAAESKPRTIEKYWENERLITYTREYYFQQDNVPKPTVVVVKI